MPDTSVQLPIDKLATLAVEHWRISSALAPHLATASFAPVRHGLRRIEDLLKSCEIEVRSLDGQPYDAGLAARVVDTLDDPRVPPGKSQVVETLAPLVLHKGTVVRPADIVVGNG